MRENGKVAFCKFSGNGGRLYTIIHGNRNWEIAEKLIEKRNSKYHGKEQKKNRRMRGRQKGYKSFVVTKTIFSDTAM